MCRGAVAAPLAATEASSDEGLADRKAVNAAHNSDSTHAPSHSRAPAAGFAIGALGDSSHLWFAKQRRRLLGLWSGRGRGWKLMLLTKGRFRPH